MRSLFLWQIRKTSKRTLSTELIVIIYTFKKIKLMFEKAPREQHDFWLLFGYTKIQNIKKSLEMPWFYLNFSLIHNLNVFFSSFWKITTHESIFQVDNCQRHGHRSNKWWREEKKQNKLQTLAYFKVKLIVTCSDAHFLCLSGCYDFLYSKDEKLVLETFILTLFHFILKKSSFKFKQHNVMIQIIYVSLRFFFWFSLCLQ